jgi:hypothetical protein
MNIETALRYPWLYLCLASFAFLIYVLHFTLSFIPIPCDELGVRAYYDS